MSYLCYTCHQQFSPRTKPANIERPFCSRSCSAIYNNKHYPKRRKVTNSCKFCSSKLNRSRRSYCSNQCQADYKVQELVSKWLETGECRAGSSKNHYVRSYILKDQNYKCAICTCDQEWNSLPLTFILDHINGDSTNSRRENLRMVCPNCDSQLPTYKGKNRGKGRLSRCLQYIKQQSLIKQMRCSTN